MLNFATIMAQKAAGLRIDPFLNFNFLVEIDGIISGAFSEVSGLTIETEVYPYQEGGVNDFVHQLPKGTKQNHLVLSRGLSDLDLFWSWYRDVINGTINRKDGMIMLFDSAMDLAMWWYFYDAYPIKWEGPTFAAYGTETVALEKVTLAHHGLSKPKESQAWSASRIVLKGLGVLGAMGKAESAIANKIESAREKYVDSTIEKAKGKVDEFGNQIADKISGTSEEKPTITKHPDSQNKSETESVMFTVTATGTGPLKYQWQKNSSDIQYANSSSYSIASLKTSDAGNYCCVVSNDYGTATSNSAALTVAVANKPPSITKNPESLDKIEGDSATFTVEASGTEPLSYQWQKEGANISVTATSKEYKIDKVKKSDEGHYRCVVSNKYGMVQSNQAVLTLGEKPTILTQPVAQTVKENDPVTFTVKAIGPLPIYYQWQKGGKDIAGATENSYNLPRVAKADAGKYRCVVKTRFGVVNSDEVTLTAQ